MLMLYRLNALGEPCPGAPTDREQDRRRCDEGLIVQVLAQHVLLVAHQGLHATDEAFEVRWYRAESDGERGDRSDSTLTAPTTARDAWVGVLSVLPLVCIELRAAFHSDGALVAPTWARLAYERGRMLIDGGRRLLASESARGDPRWMWGGVPGRLV